MNNFEYREYAGMEKKRDDLRKQGALTLSDDPILLESFNHAIDMATPEEIEIHYGSLSNNPENIQRLAINAQQLQAINDLKKSIGEISGLVQKIGTKEIEPREKSIIPSPDNNIW